MDKIDIRKSIISRIERVTIVSQNCAIVICFLNYTTLLTMDTQGQRDSIMPRSKEDDAARKREERSARPADDAAARSADGATRKREGRSARYAARQHQLQHRLAQEAATLGAAMTVAAAVDDPVAVETAPLVDETPSAKLLRAQTRITDLKANFHDSLPKKPCAIQQQPQQPFDNSTKESSLASGLAAVQRF